MRTVRYTSRFRRDYRREKSGRHRRRLDADLLATVTMLAKDEPLPRRYFDHPLGDEWSVHRDCHTRPDLILIYRTAPVSEAGSRRAERKAFLANPSDARGIGGTSQLAPGRSGARRPFLAASPTWSAILTAPAPLRALAGRRNAVSTWAARRN
jgi:mRNA interferase YafQ